MCLPDKNWTITAKDYAERTDLRGYDIASVDPPGCTDIDDALHCKKLEDGNYEVGVHIADVSHFIKPGTALDEEAASRGTSGYVDYFHEYLGIRNILSIGFFIFEFEKESTN